MGVIIFNGVKSTDFGIEVSTPPDYHMAQKKFREIEIPGRNGSLHIEEPAYKNVERIYQVSFLSRGDQANNSFPAVSSAIAGWLGASDGYCRLEDSYEPDYYRLAKFEDATVIKNIYGEGGTFELKFDCKPQRFLKSGEMAVVVQYGDKLHNPTNFPAKPLITFMGHGDVMFFVGSRQISIDFDDGVYHGVVIDCEMQEIHDGTLNLSTVSNVYEEGFPILAPGGDTVIRYTNCQSVEIIPNWWTL